MSFRFGSALLLVVLVSLVGTALEKRNLALRREVSAQHYRAEVLRDVHTALRARTQQLGAPIRLIDDLEAGRVPLRQPERPLEMEPPRAPPRRARQAVRSDQ